MRSGRQSDGALSELVYDDVLSTYGFVVDSPIVNDSVSFSMNMDRAVAWVPWSTTQPGLQQILNRSCTA